MGPSPIPGHHRRRTRRRCQAGMSGRTKKPSLPYKTTSNSSPTSLLRLGRSTPRGNLQQNSISPRDTRSIGPSASSHADGKRLKTQRLASGLSPIFLAFTVPCTIHERALMRLSQNLSISPLCGRSREAPTRRPLATGTGLNAKSRQLLLIISLHKPLRNRPCRRPTGLS